MSRLYFIRQIVLNVLHSNLRYFLSTIAVVTLLAMSGCSTFAPIKTTNVTDVAGTKWVGIDSEGSAYEFMFQPSGDLHYKSPSGFWKNGKWKQNNDEIYFEMNNKYSEYKGRIVGFKMAGDASNITGHKWHWSVQKEE